MGPIILGLLFFAVLIVLLARFAPSAAARRLAQAESRAGHPLRSPISPGEFRRLVGDLLVRGMSLEVVSDELLGSESRIVLRRPGDGMADALYVALVLPDPAGHLVDQSRVVELEQTVTALGAAGGMLFTPYAIDMTGLGAVRSDLEMIDGVRMRELLTRHLPERARELEPVPA